MGCVVSGGTARAAAEPVYESTPVVVVQEDPGAELLCLLMSALRLLREHPSLPSGPRERSAVEALARRVGASVWEELEDCIGAQARHIEALERRKTRGRRSAHAPTDSPPAIVSRRLCPVCVGSVHARTVAVQTDPVQAPGDGVTGTMARALTELLGGNRSPRMRRPLASNQTALSADAEAEQDVLSAIAGRCSRAGSSRTLHRGLPSSNSLLSVADANPGSPRTTRSRKSVLREAAQNTVVYKELARQRGHADVLLKLSLSLAGCAFNSEQVIARVMSEARRLFAAEAASFWYVDDGTGELTEPGVRIGADDLPAEPWATHTLPCTMARDIAATGVPMRVDDCNALPSFTEDSELRSVAAVPVRCDDVTVAVALVENAASFTEDDMRLLDGFATIAGVSLRNSRLFRTAVFQHKKSAVMLKTLRALAVADLEGTSLPTTIMRTAQALAHADRVALFIVNQDRGEFRAHFHTDGGGTDVLVVPMDGDIAGDVFRTGQPINLDDAYADPRFNKELDRLTGYRTRSLLCLPVTYENNIVAVAQLVNRIGADAFGEEDIELFESFAVFAGVSLRNSSHYQEMVRQRRTTELILSIVQKLSESDIRDIDSVTDKVMQGAKELTSADRCALFVTDEERNELVARVTGEEPTDRLWTVQTCRSGDSVSSDTSCSLQHPVTTEIRIPVGSGVAGCAALSAQLVNIPHAYDDPRFNPEVDRKTGYRTRAILAYPILHEGRVVAVAQLINKMDSHGRDDVFSSADERLLQVFGAFAGISIGNAQLYRFVLEAGNRAMDLFSAQQKGAFEGKMKVRIASPQSVEMYREIAISAEEKAALGEVGFPIHSYFPDTGGEDSFARLVPLSIEVFTMAGLRECLGVPDAMLYRFVATVKGMYRAVPYHNFVHAFDVMQTLHVFLHQCRARDMLTSLDCLTLLMVGLFHDLDHMGLNNSFHLKAETPLGMLSSASGSRSVLEVHHCSIAIEILSNESTNILCNLRDEEKKYIFKMMIHAILATDMSRHAELCAEFERGLNEEYDAGNAEHRQQLVTLLVKAADVSNVCKPFPTSRNWGRRVQQEFDSQGEREKTGLPSSAGIQFDVRHNLMAFGRGQISFMKGMVEPMLRLLLRRLPSLTIFQEQLCRNRARWQRAVEECSMAYTLGCDTAKGIRYRYYYKLAAYAVHMSAVRGKELDVVAHIAA